MKKSNCKQFTKVKFDEIIDIKLDQGFYPDDEVNIDYEEIEPKPRRCFAFKKKDVVAIWKELLKSNPKII